MRVHRVPFHAQAVFFLLLVALLAAPAVAAKEHSSSSALTIRTELVVPADIERTGQELILAGIEISGSELLSVRWTRVDGAWFPYWVLRLVTATPGGAMNSTELSTITPIPGATYHTVLSWDSALEALSVQLTDATTDRSVYSTGMSAPPLPGQAAPSDTATAHVTTSGTVTRVQGSYVPLGLRWEPGIAQETGFFPTLRFERTDHAEVRIQIPGPVPADGVFRLLTGEGQRELAHAQPQGPTTDLSFPVSHMPIGRSELLLTYTANGEDLATWAQSITVGNVAARYDEVVRDPSTGTVHSTLWLESASSLPGVNVDVRAHVFEMQWHETSRGYQELRTTEIQLLSQEIDVEPGTVGIPLEFPAPDQPGVWKVVFDTELSPDVLQFEAKPPYYFSTYEAAAIDSGDSFTIVVLPDTQYYAQNHPHIFMRQAEWIAANAKERSIGLVLHMGDVTNANTWEQWRVAANSMKLLNHVVPYVLNVGNHDNFPEGRPNGQTARRGDSKINAFFFPHEFPHLRGTFEPDRLENAFYTLNLGGRDYLIISLEFAPSDEMVDWADQVTAAHPDHTVILVTHTYTNHYGLRTPVGQVARHYDIGHNPDTTVNDGEAIWQKFVRKHPNIQFVLSGHIHSSVIPYSAAIGDHGNTVYEVLMDYQSEEFGGNGYLVVWTFHGDGTVDVQAYSPYLGQVKTDVEAGFRNEFTLLLDLSLDGMLDSPVGSVRDGSKG